MSPSTPIAPVLMLAADHYKRYPGELSTLYLRFTAPDQPDVTLQISMPRVIGAESYRLPPNVPSTLPSIVEQDSDVIVLMPLQGYITPGQTVEIEVGLRLSTFYGDQHLHIDAQLVLESGAVLDTASLRLTVFGKSSFLRHLPEIYESDDFTSRLLMLFESFWNPINCQIDQIEQYFDPALTPPAFVPWLASWLGMSVDPSLPLDRVRTLLKNALMLFQCRGTILALSKYLEIYTAGRVSIIEQRATNLVLGPGATFGKEIALGKNNQPNCLQINLAVSPTELDRTRYTREIYRRKINDVVRALVPAHVQYHIQCEFSLEPS